MCGFLITTADTFRHEQMRALQRRGPDGLGFYVDDRIKMSHARLAIVGLDDRGVEPLENETHVLVMNGEIFNWATLRDDLRSIDGFGLWREEMPTDAHVLLHLWSELGADCLSMLTGFWAFAVYDKRDGTVTLCRDQLGIKPLYYTTDMPFKAASTIAALDHHGELDYAALSEYVRYQFTFGAKTFFKNVNKVLPGEVRIIPLNTLKAGYAINDPNGIQSRIYEDIWSRPDAAMSLPWTGSATADWLAETRHIMTQCILESRSSDAGFTTFCSGGIDSGIVTRIAKPIHAWHCNYSDPECNETAFAREVADGTCRLLVHNADDHPDLVSRLQSLIDDFDELTIGSVILPLDELLGRVRARGDKVILSGTGGDELFGGYVRYQLALGHGYNDSYRSMFERVKNMPWAVAFEDSHAKGADIYKFMDKDAAKLAFFRAFDAAGDTIGFDRRHFLTGLLNIDDRISGRHGLESRPSLLHQRFVRRMMEIDVPVVPEIKRFGKQLARGIVPDSVIDRRDKMGFSTPIGTFVRDNTSQLREYISSSRHRDLFDLDAVQWTPERGAGKWDRSVFGLALLCIWLDRYN